MSIILVPNWTCTSSFIFGRFVVIKQLCGKKCDHPAAHPIISLGMPRTAAFMLNCLLFLYSYCSALQLTTHKYVDIC